MQILTNEQIEYLVQHKELADYFEEFVRCLKKLNDK